MVVASASTSTSLNLSLPNHHHHHHHQINACSISNSNPNRSLSSFAFATSSHSLSKLGLGLGLTASKVPPLRHQQLQVLSMRPHKAELATKESWDKILNSEVPVLVEFYASWCGPCRMVHRIIDEIAEDYAGKIKCFVLNTDNDLEIAEDYDIKAVPVVLLFKNGEKRESVIGTMPRDFYVAAIERVLAS